MNNILEFPIERAGPTVDALLAEPPARCHAVQFYEQDDFLFDAVGRFLAAGLAAGDHVIVIATSAHRDGLVERLREHDVASAVAAGRLMLLDAHDTLARFMVGGMPDPDRFHDVLGCAIAKLTESGPARIRAYGEMVDLLWREGNSRGALRLEELWNDAGKQHAFSLLCAYAMGNFYSEGASQEFIHVCERHSHVLPTEQFTRLDDPHARLREISLLQQRARALEREVQHRKELEEALRDALRSRSRIEDELRDSLRREQSARSAAEANDAFKEVFLGILGHDLRNPLNTILATIELLLLTHEVSGADIKRLIRMSSSGERMRRMIDQLLDMTRCRLAEGIVVTRREQDLVPIVTGIVDEHRTANHGHCMELLGDDACPADVDRDRFEQVASNLIGNAVTHGDARRPITVTIAQRGELASFRVHNFGPIIDEPLRAVLFDPFRRGKNPASDGLGLGLYISERIVHAHGGRIEVSSNLDSGTLFEVVLPCS